jgi:hypothetical protein
MAKISKNVNNCILERMRRYMLVDVAIPHLFPNRSAN